MAGTCQIEGCSKTSVARKFCSLHYQRWRAHGDPHFTSFTAATRGDPAAFFNSIVVHHTDDSCLVWPYSKNKAGYGKMWMGGKLQDVHRLACDYSNGTAPSAIHQAAHQCGNKSCVNPRHLTWKTPAENCADKLRHGTLLRGEDHPRSKLTNSDVARIRTIGSAMFQRDIADLFGVEQTTIGRILRGEKWSHLK